jgi:hypothetical protein
MSMRWLMRLRHISLQVQRNVPTQSGGGKAMPERIPSFIAWLSTISAYLVRLIWLHGLTILTILVATFIDVKCFFS